MKELFATVLVSDDRDRRRKQLVPTDVVAVTVGIDEELDGLVRQLLDGFHDLVVRGLVHFGVDDQHTIISDVNPATRPPSAHSFVEPVR